MSDGQTDGSGMAEEDQIAQEESANADLTFLELDQNGTVDLDALFDALNIAAVEGNTPVEFLPDGNEGGGTLLISGSDLTLGTVASEDLPDVSDLLLKSSIASDES